VSHDFGETEEQRRERVAAAVSFAGGYVPRDPHVLARLHHAAFAPLPPTATHAQMAYAEGQRYLISQLIRQYQLATTGSPDTPWPPILSTSPHPPSSPPPQPRPHKRQPRKRR